MHSLLSRAISERARKVGERLLACAAFFLLLGAGTASAATYTVTTLGDSAGTCSGTSPNFSCTTLRAAIIAANATTGVADTIQFSVAGTINVTSALPQVTDTLTINGTGIILNGGGGAYYAIHFLGAGASGSQLLNTTITNFRAVFFSLRLSAVAAEDAANVTFSNNTIMVPNSAASDGIRCQSADNCTVTNNTVTGAAYAIAVFNPGVQPAGFNGAVTGNVISNSNDSGIGLFNADNVIVDNNTIAAQFVGIRLSRDSVLDGGHTSNNTITNNTITGAANDGILLDNFYTTGVLNTVNNNLIQGNSISGGSGNGISLESNAVVQINGNVITGNTITGMGGDGVAITGTNAANNAIYANSISANGGLGIDLNNDGVTANDAGDGDTGPNGLQNYPVLTGATTGSVNFTLDTSANANGYRIDFYNNPGGVDPTGFGEGQTWLGSCVVASPSATVPTPCSIAGVDPATLRMTATSCTTAGCTATCLDGSSCTAGATSEFSGPALTDLRITKDDGVTGYGPGQTLTYTIVATNAGATTVFNALFTDPAVTGLTVNSVTCDSATAGSQCSTLGTTTVALMQGSGIVIPTLTPGGSVTFTVNATVSNTMTGTLTNTATIAPPSGLTESTPVDNTATDTDTQLPNFGACDARMFLTQSPNGSTPTTLYDIGTSTNPLTFTSRGTGTLTYNATGYNPADNSLYAIQNSTNNLLRINPNGSTTNLGAVVGLPTSPATSSNPFYRSGAFDDTGDRYFVIDGNASNTGNMQRLYVIDVTTKTATFVSLSQAIGDQIADIAYVNGLLYSVTVDGQLISINPSNGTVTNIGSPNGVTNGKFFGAMFGATNGLFGVLNDGNFYQIDIATGAVTLISAAPASNSNDGANCAAAPITFGADLQVTKTNTPAKGPDDLDGDAYTPGTDVFYTIVVSNPGPFGAQNATVNDPLPAGITTASWTCATTAGGAACGAASGTGAINDTGADLPVGGSLTYTLTLTIPDEVTGDLTNTAAVTPGGATTDPTPDNNIATDTDTAAVRVTLSKVSLGGVGSFDFTGDNGIAVQTLTTTVAGTPVSGAVQVLTTAGTATTITEAAPPAGYTLTDVTCTGLGNGGSATPNLAARTVTLDAAATANGANITCTFTNTLQPTLALTKTWSGALVNDEAQLSAAGGSGSPALSSTANAADETDTSVAVQMAVGDVITLSETLGAGNAGNYSASAWSCTGGALAGSTLTLTSADAGQAIVCTVTNTRLQPKFATCDSQLWLSQTATLNQLGTATNPFTVTAVGTSPFDINAIGYNPADSFIYGIRQPGSNELVRIGADGVGVSLGPVSGLPVNDYNAGTFDTSGNVLYAKAAAAGANRIFAIDVTTLTATAINLTAAVDSADLAWVGGLLYAVRDDNGQLVSIDPATGVVTNIGPAKALPGGPFGALYGAPNGLFGSGNNGGFYQVNLANGAFTLISGSPASTANDGANCPLAPITFGADLSITKTDGQTQYVPGTNVVYTIVVSNAGPFGAFGMTVSDPLPAGIIVASWSCVASSGAACAASGSGAINDTAVDLPVGATATYTLTLAVPADFTGDLVNTATVTAGTGTVETDLGNNTATDTDSAAAKVTVSKVSLGGVGSFDFTGDNGIAAQTLTTIEAGTPVSGATQVLTTAGTVTTVTEAAPPAGYTLTGVTCTGLGTGGTATPDLAARTVTLDAAATASGANIACTFTNTLQPTLALAKTWVNAAISDTATLSATGGAGNPTLVSAAETTSETDTGAAVQMAVGDVVNLTETLVAANDGAYDPTPWSCTGGTLVDSTLTLGDDDAGTAIVCTITNTRQTTDVQVVKTATPDPVISGDVITYTLTVTNNGGLDTTNVLLTDTPGPGLDCTTPSSTATCSATNGASCPGATVLMSDLLGAGVSIPALPVDGEVVVIVQCTVTATGL